MINRLRELVEALTASANNAIRNVAGTRDAQLPDRVDRIELEAPEISIEPVALDLSGLEGLDFSLSESVDGFLSSLSAGLRQYPPPQSPIQKAFTAATRPASRPMEAAVEFEPIQPPETLFEQVVESLSSFAAKVLRIPVAEGRTATGSLLDRTFGRPATPQQQPRTISVAILPIGARGLSTRQRDDDGRGFLSQFFQRMKQGGGANGGMMPVNS